jgi:hypothetical protein
VQDGPTAFIDVALGGGHGLEPGLSLLGRHGKHLSESSMLRVTRASHQVFGVISLEHPSNTTSALRVLVPGMWNTAQRELNCREVLTLGLPDGHLKTSAF